MSHTFASMFFTVLCATVVSAQTSERIVYQDDFEKDLDRKVQVSAANQPYKAHTIGLTTERAHSGKHSVKIDVTFNTGLTIRLTPRTNETPQVEYGTPGSVGSFLFKPINLPLAPDKGYLLSCYLWIERASTAIPVRVGVETITQTAKGPIRNDVQGENMVTPTGRWVKVERELTSWVVDQLDARGAKTRDLCLSGINVESYALTSDRMTVYVDDLVIREVPASVTTEYRKRDREAATKSARPFKSCPEAENFFPWGVYGDPFMPGPDWIRPVDRASTKPARTQQKERLVESADPVLLEWRRHYCNFDQMGGGMLMTGEGVEARAYVQAALDKHAEYGLKLCPSTYLTQFYTNFPKARCEEAMRKAVQQFKNHPALLGYLLFDEPDPSHASDLYWGKAFMESLDPRHPALSNCNGFDAVKAFAPVMPLLCIDYYPLSPSPAYDLGAWAVGDMVRYARTRGAKRIWVVPPVFGFSSWRSPSVTEFDVVIFSSLAEGATGFFVYSWAERPGWWLNALFEYGDLVDPYGNPNPVWTEMKRLGPLVRSAGPLLIGSPRLADEAVTAHTSRIVVSPVGRKRPMALARGFTDPNRKATYIIAYNNSLTDPITFKTSVKDMKVNEKVLDLFSLKEVTVDAGGFSVSLPPGDGRMYAVAAPDILEQVKNEVSRRRFDIERDLLALEIRVAQKMGTVVTAVQESLATADGLALKGEWEPALAAVGQAAAVLDGQNRANEPYQQVLVPLEQTRVLLGRLNKLMNQRIGEAAGAYPRNDPKVKPLRDQMVALSERFYSLQRDLLARGPGGLGEEARNILKTATAFHVHTAAFFGREKKR